MPFFIPALLAGLSAAGGVLGNRKNTREQSSTQNTHSYGEDSSVNQSWSHGRGSSMPTYDPLQMQVRDNLLNLYTNRANERMPRVGNVANSIITGQQQNINQMAQGQGRAMQSNLASRGLAYSPAASLIQANIDANRHSQLVQSANQAPQIQLEMQKLYEEMQNNRLKQAGGFFSSLPVGTTTTDDRETYGSSNNYTNRYVNQSGTGTIEDPGNMLGGGFQGLSSMLAYLFGKGAFGPVGGGSGKLSSSQGSGFADIG